MIRRLTEAQRLLLADSVRVGLVGWLVTCPQAGLTARALKRRATTPLSFSFSRFATAAAAAFGAGYRPKRPTGADGDFPLSLAEAVALANDIELDLADEAALRAAGEIVVHSPFAQPAYFGENEQDDRSNLNRASGTI
jgi:hypothetical protein